MTAYYRISDARVVDLTAEQVAALAPSKQETLRPYSVDPQPTPSATQRVDVGPVVVSPIDARRTWVLVDLTPLELENAQLRAQREAEYALIRQAYRALKNGTGTAGERLTRCERVLARLLQDQFGAEPA